MSLSTQSSCRQRWDPTSHASHACSTGTFPAARLMGTSPGNPCTPCTANHGPAPPASERAIDCSSAAGNHAAARLLNRLHVAKKGTLRKGCEWVIRHLRLTEVILLHLLLISMCYPHLHVRQDGKKKKRFTFIFFFYNTHMENSRLHACEKAGLHACLGECSKLPLLPLYESRHSACKPEHIWAKVCLNVCISRDLIINERCSFAVCLNGGTEVPRAHFRWCVSCFPWQTQIWATVNELVCVQLEGRCMWVTGSTREQVSAESGI